MSITVKEALNVGKLNKGKVIAGRDGLDRIIKYVDILEVPEAVYWFREKVLMFTTGYAIKEKPDIQVKLIEELAKKGAAGLVIKKNRFLKKIPQEMIDKANTLKLPIILIPSDIPYIEITHPILSEILKRQSEKHYIKEKFGEIIQKSKTLSEQTLKYLIKQIKKDFIAKPPYRVLIIAFEKFSNLEKHINLNNMQHLPNIIAGEFDSNFVCICSSCHKLDIDRLLNKSFVSKPKLKCIVSGKIYNLKQINRLYYKMFNCLAIAPKIPWLKGNIFFYDKICHYLLLNNLNSKEKSLELISDLLLPLNQLDNGHKETLLKTLYYYVKNGGNKTRAAKECYIHRNTFNYRMDKLKKIFDSPLDDPEEIYKYRLTLDLYFMLTEHSGLIK